MALYRLYKPEWEASLRKVTEAYREKAGLAPPVKGKRKRGDSEGADGDDGDDDDEGAERSTKKKQKEFPGGGRKGVSSGLSVVVKRFGKKVESDQPRRRGLQGAPASSGNWWEQGAS
jgi:RNA exonuclease 4